MIEIWARGSYLVVEGVKRHRQRESLFRRLSAKLLYRILMAGASLDLRASTDYKLLDRCVVDAYLKMPETGRFFRGLTAWLGFPTAQLEIAVPEREGTGTRWSLGALVNYARRTVVIFTALPLRSMSWVGTIGFSASVLMMLQTLWNKWLGHSEAGFPTVIILVVPIWGALFCLAWALWGSICMSSITRLREGRYMWFEVTSDCRGATSRHGWDGPPTPQWM